MSNHINRVTVVDADTTTGATAERQALLEMRAVTTHYGPIRVLNEAAVSSRSTMWR